MHLSRQSFETLIDLIENKLSTMEIWDRDDRREVQLLKRCLSELQGGLASTAPNGAVVGFPESGRRRGRRPKTQLAH